MAHKAGVVFTTDPRGGEPLGVALETDTGHLIEWRFANEERSAGILRRIGLLAWWWERIPALSVYGTEGLGLNGDQDFLSPREWFYTLCSSSYARNFLWLVPPETTVDAFWRDTLNLRRPADGLAPLDEGARDLIPVYPPWRPGDLSLDDPSYVDATVAMLMDGIVGYFRPIESTDTPTPIFAHRRLGDLVETPTESQRSEFRRRLLDI